MNVAPTRRALAVVAAGLAVAVVPAVVSLRLWPLWLLYAGGTVLAAAVDAVLAPRRGDLRWELATPTALAVGERAAAVLDLAVEPRLAGSGKLEATAVLDLDGPAMPVAARRLALSRSADGEPRAAALRGVASFPLTPRRRGLVRIERLWLRLPGPLGLMERTVTAEVDRVVEVHPDLGRVRRAAVQLVGPRTSLPGLKIERYVGDGTDFEALREFEPGYDSRAIDWKATARHRRLLCRETRAEREQPVVVAFDTGRLMAEPVGGGGPDANRGTAIPRLDHAIHAGLLLAYVALRAGDRVGLYAFDERPRMFAAPRGGSRWFPALLGQTASLAYTEAETNFTLGLTELAGRLHRRSLVVVLTDFVDSVAAELMAENLTRLARRHLVVFVALRDPLLGELIAAAPRSMLDVQRAVVAAGLQRDRERVLARLRRLGVFALDLPPSRVEPRLLGRYLEIKRKEMIA